MFDTVGRPAPGNRNDCRAYHASGTDRQCRGVTVMADGGYSIHKRVRARLEHALAHMTGRPFRRK